MKLVFLVIVLLFWICSGLYFGVAGLTRANMDEKLADLQAKKTALKLDSLSMTVGDTEVKNQYELQKVLEVTSVDNLFPWAVSLSSFVSLIVTALFFGQLGAVICLFKMIVIDKKKITEIPVYSLPILGLLSGLVVFGITHIIPTILIEGVNKTRPISLMFLCLFSGIFLEKFYTKVGAYFDKIFL